MDIHYLSVQVKSEESDPTVLSLMYSPGRFFLNCRPKLIEWRTINQGFSLQIWKALCCMLITSFWIERLSAALKVSVSNEQIVANSWKRCECGCVCAPTSVFPLVFLWMPLIYLWSRFDRWAGTSTAVVKWKVLILCSNDHNTPCSVCFSMRRVVIFVLMLFLYALIDQLSFTASHHLNARDLVCC